MRLSIEHAANCAAKAGSILGNRPGGMIGKTLPVGTANIDLSMIGAISAPVAGCITQDEHFQQRARAAVLPGLFDASRAQVFRGTSTWTFNSPFGFVAPGVGTRRDEALITFRGSSRPLQDYILIDGAAAFGTSSKGYAAHGGFTTVFNSCRKQLDPILNALPANIRTIHITGHSMGGALATLAAEHLIGSRFHTYLYPAFPIWFAVREGMAPEGDFPNNFCLWPSRDVTCRPRRVAKQATPAA